MSASHSIPAGAERRRVCLRNYAGTPTDYVVYRDGKVWRATPLSPSYSDAELPESEPLDYSLVKMDGPRMRGWKEDFEPAITAGYYIAVQNDRGYWHVRTDSVCTSRQALAEYVSKIAGVLLPSETRVMHDGKDVGTFERDLLGTGRHGLCYYDNVPGAQWAWIADRSEAICIRS